MIKKGIVIGIIIVFIVGSLASGITINQKETVHQSSRGANEFFNNNPPIINSTFPGNGKKDVSVSGAPINVEIFDSDNDSLYVEIWSNFTGIWVEYASWDVMLDWQNHTWSNESALIFVDYNNDDIWNVVDLVFYFNSNGWGISGNWGFYDNMTVTDDWGMIDYSTTYYWSVNVTDNLKWTNETFHFTTELTNIYDIYVDDDAPPEWYDATHVKTINEGINNASEGDTVFVYSGTYYENVVVDKIINFIGENKDTTIIDGGGNEDVVHIFADNVSVSNFLTRNSGNINGCAGIEVNNANGCTISNNNVSQNQDGIHIDNSDFNKISYNNVYYNYDDGIDLDYSSNNYIFDNKIKNNVGSGIGFSYDNTNNVFYNNTIISNDRYGIDFSKTDNEDNKLYHNNLLTNIIGNARDYSNNIWNDNYPSGGNYWDDYDGIDADGDGIGDSPYDIPSGSNQDLYPLMKQWGENPPVANFTYLVDENPTFFNASSSYDRDGIIVNWTWDFGDGTTGDGIVSSHTYSETGTYEVKLTVTDDDGLTGDITKTIEVEVVNQPPEAPIINGPTSGKPGTSYSYRFNSTDSENDDVYYYIDWGDDTYTDWFGPFSSGIEIEKSHVFENPGTFNIYAKAKDIFGDESDWGTLTVTMPRDKLLINLFILQLFERFPLLERILKLVI